MFEKNTKFRIRTLLEREFTNIKSIEKTVVVGVNSGKQAVHVASSPNERNMTRKTRSRQLRIHSAFQSGYCAICHIPYNNLGDHIQTKRHLKLIGDDGNFISLKGFDDQDTLLSLDGIDVIDVKNCDISPYITRTKMPKTRTSVIKDSSLSPTINNNDSGHHLRSRKNINYMTPPLEDDSSLTEKPEIKEYRELRSSSRLLAKLTDQIVGTDEVWNSGRPKRSCNRQRISADERLVADNKSYYKVEVLPSKLRSGIQLQYNQNNNKRVETRAPPPPPHLLQSNDKIDEKFIVKFKKLRNSELIRLNNEAENFLFPKKDESFDDTNDEDDDEEDVKNDDDSEKIVDNNNEFDETKLDNSSLSNDGCFNKKIKIEDDESSHSICSDGKNGKKRRRTHAEAFIMDNQKYYKFETPGSSCYRLRYQGSYLSPVGWKQKNNGDTIYNIDKKTYNETNILTSTTSATITKNEDAQLDLNEINFSFENIPKDENWYKTFRRKDTGDEKYVFVDDDNYWDPLILPYQLDYVPPLDPKICLSTYNQIKKILIEPSSTSTSVGPSTPDPNTSNSASSIDYTQDEDSKISTTMTEISSTSTIDELKPVLIGTKRKKRSSTKQIINENGNKNPRKSPRQHASTLAILSSLIQQRKRKSRNEIKSKVLPTILEEEQQQQQKRHSRSPRYKRCYRRYLRQNIQNDHQNQEKIDYFAIARNLDDELAVVVDDNLAITETINSDDDNNSENPIVFNNNNNNNNKIDVIDLLNNYDTYRLQQQQSQTNRDRDYYTIGGSGNCVSVGNSRGRRRITGNRPGRKPGRKKKKNRTGWPNRNIRRIRRDHRKDDDLDDSTLDSISVNADTEDNEEICENNTTDNISNSEQQQQRLSDNNNLNSEDCNKNDQISLNDCNDIKDDRVTTKLNDLNNGDDTVLTDKIDSNVNTQYETCVCVQKLDNVDNNNKTVVATTVTTTPTDSGRSTSPKRTNRSQRRMPASPKSPRMLRRPRGRWYRER